MSFETVQLQSICKKIVSGGTPKSTNPDFYSNGTIPWIKTKEVNNNRIYVSENYITELGLKNSSAKIIPENSILIAMYGNGDTAGRVAINKIPVSTNQACCNLIIDNSKADYRYVFYYLRTQYQRLVDLKNGGAQQNLNSKTIKEYPFPNPPLHFQNAVADILEYLDDKIAINKNINLILEQMAQTLFKSWFVDFEPVKAKMVVLEAGGSQEEATLAAMTAISGKDVDSLVVFEHEQPEQYAELKATAELFPSAMQGSELGVIPEKWAVCNIKSKTTELRRGISPKYTEETDGIVVINQKCIRNHKINFSFSRLHDAKKRIISGRELQVGDVLINSTGTGTLGRLAPIRYLSETTIADSHITVVRADTTKITASYLSELLIRHEKFIESNGSGSTGQTELRKEVIEEIKFPCPPLILGQLFEKLASRFNAKISLLEKQITLLSNLRDTLLPKLLSGEITLPETEQAVSEATHV